MGWATLPKPGTNAGPCAKNCKHIDCAETRNMAASTCRLCGEAIGYDHPFYNDDQSPTHLVHTKCAHNLTHTKHQPT